MDACRNCGSPHVKNLGFIGELAPFFLKRVFHMEIGFASSPDPRKRAVQRLMATPQKALSRIRRHGVMVEVESCTSCTFVQTKYAFADESLSNLYADYRSPTYNRERIHYEPSYKHIADEVGSGQKETETRIEALTNWMSTKIPVSPDFSMLDYGGADGRFLPRLPGTKYVYDISDIQPADGVVSIKKETDLGTYSYIQLAHILEHVPRPLEMVRTVSKWLAPEGYLYIEVPQDFSDSAIEQLVAGSYRGTIPIHEHINLYTSTSAARLIESAGLRAVHVEVEHLDLGWAQATHVRALGRRMEPLSLSRPHQ